MSDKAQFFWAIIGDANPEPVSVVVEDGKRVAYTIGCPDPFDLDGPDANIELVRWGGMYGGANWKEGDAGLEIPKKTTGADIEKRRVEAEKRLARDAKRGIAHGWKRWNP